MAKHSNTPDLNTSLTAADVRSNSRRNIISTILYLLAAPVLAIFLTTFVFRAYQVEGQSMESTLHDQDHLVISKLPRSWARITDHAYIPNRGDIIVFVKHGLYEPSSPSGDKDLIKRVIGLPGDHVVIQAGVITIYNDTHPRGFNPDTAGIYSGESAFTPANIDLIVPTNELFVCGDNRSNSRDSRSFGTISVSDIIGKLVFRLTPMSKARSF